MKRIILAVLIALLLVSFAEGAGKFAAFPTIGICTGDSVRYRAKPDTNAEIWGSLSKNMKVVVESQKVVDGETWYEISPKDAQDTAYVYGEYLVPYFDEEAQKSPVNKMVIDILQVYSPYEDNDYYTEYGGEEVKRTYDKSGWLVRVEAWKKGCSFGNDGQDESKNITIGDDVSKLAKLFGEPDNKSDSECEYTAGTSSLTFKIENGKITRMIYEDKK